MKLIFKNSHGQERIIANPETEDEAMTEIITFCGDHNFEISYMRVWVEGNRKCFDCGSYLEFFYLEE